MKTGSIKVAGSAKEILSYFVCLVLLMASISCDTDNGDDDDDTDGSTITVSLEEVTGNLTSPLVLVEPPDDPDKLFVVDQIGEIRIIESGVLLETPFLDIKNKIIELNGAYDERGLLGLAFHPDYASNGRFFVHYSAPPSDTTPDSFDHTAIIAEFTESTGDDNTADVGSERILLAIDEPQTNHNGGSVAFGPDGYLYLSLGDGGNRDDMGVGHVEDWYEDNAGGNGQDIEQNLLGSILRIDVDGDDPYGIPSDNPLTDEEGMDEIYAYGFRNPYRMTFDMGGDHGMYVSDAGQELWEEISKVELGGNYGWNVKEGTHCFDTENPESPPTECPPEDSLGNTLIDPVIEFRNAKNGGLGLVIVGGYVYRGSEVSDLSGYYIFGSWSSSQQSPEGEILISDTQQTGELWDFEELGLSQGALGHYLLAFGQDQEGEVYVLTSDNTGPSGNTGKVYKIVQ